MLLRMSPADDGRTSDVTLDCMAPQSGGEPGGLNLGGGGMILPPPRRRASVDAGRTSVFCV